MAYNVYFACEKCCKGYSWVNGGPNYNMAVRIAREKGWQVGKRGWYCPEHRTRKRKGEG